MTDRAPTYEEVLASARRAREQIEREWPAWKRALSEPEPERRDHSGAGDEGRDDPKRR